MTEHQRGERGAAGCGFLALCGGIALFIIAWPGEPSGGYFAYLGAITFEPVAAGVRPGRGKATGGRVLHASGVPLAEPMPAWLVDELGGRWQQAAT